MKLVELRKSDDEEVIRELKESKKPLLIYGCANHAELVWRYLQNHGLDVEAFIVDSKYYKKELFICSIKVKEIAEYEKNLEQYNIVIGFCNVEKSKFLIYNAPLLKNKFYFLWQPLEMYSWDKKYLRYHQNELCDLYNDLADTYSKNVMKELIDAKLNFSGKKLLEWADDKQYFNELTFSFDSRNEIYVDCGAFTGDTIMKYISFTDGIYQKIYAFEPERENISKLKENVKSFKNIKIIEQGTWKKRTILNFENKGSASQIVDRESKTRVSVVTIDEVVKGEKVTFIKMDVEGSELDSLIGASETISHNMPKLAICCYHKKDDLLNLYHYIKSFDNDNAIYQFYLRHHSNSVYETVLYAIPVKIKDRK